MHKLSTNYPCNLKLWLLYHFTIVFRFMQKNVLLNWLKAILNGWLQIYCKSCDINDRDNDM